MAEPFVAEIRIFPFNFPPRGWAFCNGQLLPISQNTALFSLLGTNYGGDGKSTFGLPNLQGTTPISQGQGPGLSQYFVGENGGSETVTLLTTELPSHTHTASAQTVAATVGDPNGATFAEGNFNNQGVSGPVNFYIADAATPQTTMSGSMVQPAGSSLPHNNMMPYLTLNFCIALQGVFPPRG